jgi:apolipoprotein N-acyltransferase
MAPSWIALSAFMPWIVFRQRTRTRAAGAAFIYFAAASAPIPLITEDPATGIGLLITASAVLTAPWIVMWKEDAAQRFWRIPLALILSAIPPIGIINWASPLTAAGLFYPGTGLLGLAATALTEAIWPVHPKAIAAAILAANLLYVPPAQPQEIKALNTADSPDTFQKEESARQAVDHADSGLTVLPEGAVRRWTEATEVYWADTINQLQTAKRIALIGAGVPIPNSDEFHNSVLTIGNGQSVRFDQRIPIPVGMWKPFGHADGVPLNLTGPGTLNLGQHRLAVLICYELLLVWPMVHSALESPTLIVGISNATWTKHTYIPAAQQAYLQAWSRLFGVPYVSAVNL